MAMTKTMKKTLVAMLVLFIISASSVLLLSLANYFMKPQIKLDAKTVALINTIAPTGYDDAEALSGKHIAMVDLANSSFSIKSLDEFNTSFGTKTRKIQAVYTSTNRQGKETLVVQSEGVGYEDGLIVMLVAYDENQKISGIINKSQSGQSYWGRLGDMEKFYASFIGLSGEITTDSIASATGATVKSTLGGIADAVSIANVFAAESKSSGESQPPTLVTNTTIISKLKKVSGAAIFTQYFVKVPNKIATVYKGDNDDIIYETLGDGGTYGKVTLYVTATADKKIDKILIKNTSFSDNPPDNISSSINDSFLNNMFGGKTLSDIKNMDGGSLAGTTGATQSANGIKNALINALEYVDVFKEAHNL